MDNFGALQSPSSASCGIHYNAGSVINTVKISATNSHSAKVLFVVMCCLLLCVLHGGNRQVPTAGRQVVTFLHSHHGKYSNTKGCLTRELKRF